MQEKGLTRLLRSVPSEKGGTASNAQVPRGQLSQQPQRRRVRRWPKSSKRILLTGTTGYIGGRLSCAASKPNRARFGAWRGAPNPSTHRLRRGPRWRAATS